MQQIYTCPNCNAPVAYGQPSCSNCGMAMDWGIEQPPLSEYDIQQQDITGYSQQSYLCPTCGGQVMYGETYCSYCGAIFYWEDLRNLSSSENNKNTINQQDWQQQLYTQQEYVNQQSYDQFSYSNQPPYGYNKRRRKSKPISKQLLSIIAISIFLVTCASIFIAINDKPSPGNQVNNSTSSEPEWVPNTQPLIKTFIFSPTEILAGQATTLSWNALGANSVSIDQNIGTVPVSGTASLFPASTTTYVITATNNFGSSSATTLVTVNPVAPVIISFTANPPTIIAGQSATLQWNITGATSVTINQGVGPVEITGTKSVSPITTITYIITASNSAGIKTSSTVLTVTPLGSPTINSFTASPDTIIAGQSATLQWNISGATSIFLDQAIGDVSSNITQVVTPTTSTTYTISAVNSAGSKTAKVSVNVTAPSALAITMFNANPSSIAPGASSTLSWNVNGSTSVSIDQGIGAVSPSGSRTVNPTSNTTYILTATNSINTVNATAPITIDTSSLSAPIITSFTASAQGISASTNITVYAGTPVTFLFTSNNIVTSASISPDVGTMTYNYVTIPVTRTTIYTLTATNGAGSTTATVTVNVPGT